MYNVKRRYSVSLSQNNQTIEVDIILRNYKKDYSGKLSFFDGEENLYQKPRLTLGKMIDWKDYFNKVKK